MSGQRHLVQSAPRTQNDLDIIPRLLPARTIPNAKAFLLLNHCPTEVVAQENKPAAEMPKPTPWTRKI